MNGETTERRNGRTAKMANGEDAERRKTRRARTADFAVLALLALR
jgi:hypothetical protein